jgi:DNA replication protein DnaC
MEKIQLSTKTKEILSAMLEEKKQGFFIHSPAGYGKTYILQEVIEQQNQIRAIRVNGEVVQKAGFRMHPVGELFDDLQLAMRQEKFYYDLDAIKKKPILFLDDLGAEKYSEFREEVLYKIIDYRYRNKLPVYITSNLSTSELAEKYSVRLVSRILEMCLIVELEGEDRRLQGKKSIKI